MNELSSRDAVLQGLHQVAPEADLDALAPEAELREELDLDSMDFLNFVQALHELTGVDVPEHDYPRLLTAASCATYLDQRRTAPHGD
jgi:acyl carrier protein